MRGSAYQAALSRIASSEVKSLAASARPGTLLMTMQASRYADTITLLKIIDSMREHGIHPNEVTYEILVLRYAEMQHLELALQVLHQLTTDGLQPHSKRRKLSSELLEYSAFPALLWTLRNRLRASQFDPWNQATGWTASLHALRRYG